MKLAKISKSLHFSKLVFSWNVGGIISDDLRFLLSDLICSRCFDIIFLQEVTNGSTLPKETFKDYSIYFSDIVGARKRSALVIPSSTVCIQVCSCEFGICIETSDYVACNIHLPSNASDEAFEQAVQKVRRILSNCVYKAS